MRTMKMFRYLEKECKRTKKGGAYYEFCRNTRSVNPTILHFKNTLEAFWKDLPRLKLVHWLFLKKLVHWLLIAGGFEGELICKYLDRPGVSFFSRTTYDVNAIINAVEIYDWPSGAVHFMASNNDRGVRDFDAERCQLAKQFSFPWPVNVRDPQECTNDKI